VGALGATGVIPQKLLSLDAPLSTTVPNVFDGYVGTDVEIDAEEQRVVGFTEYVLRNYEAPVADGGDESPASGVSSFSVYVGYYAGQTQGRTIHSPKNCLPGSGWEALESELATVGTPDGQVGVNRYLIKNGEQRALVLYWYQGRGRVQASEYRVKWDLLRDAALRQRSDEALVRIVVPLSTSEDDSFRFAATVARRLIPVLDQALPD
jgi:EpsI family protein